LQSFQIFLASTILVKQINLAIISDVIENQY